MTGTVRVRAFARFREVLGDRLEIPLPAGSTVRHVVNEVVRANPAASALLLDSDGHLKKSVIVMVNRERVGGPDREDHPVNPGDEVALYPPVAGG
ncbi:MAG: MoaD/ThiS family protein [Methanolinea sp.]|nr:MoaD/ThiS family protein [Methanolinea sp.]